jgi:hypothetical protein
MSSPDHDQPDHDQPDHDQPDHDQAAEHFTTALAAHHLSVPDRLWAGTLAGYCELRQLAGLLHAPRPAADEPSAVYRMPENPGRQA